MPIQPEPERPSRCFAPVCDADVRLLVLGSLPGQRSLAMQQYYAHPQNQFWRLMSEVTGASLVALPYEERLAGLLACGIGLWDVINEATRPGSLDTRITGALPNDLAALLASLPKLRAMAFNGKTASRIGRRQLAGTGSITTDMALIDLPSSSPAYTLSYAEKARNWIMLRDWIGA
ncbi:DNA-deoxyinosine glycosylase [Sphingobium sp. DEHP117]|uniref:DNA-deoxyinosine glycosylase n=1 Tax=Sphingobium sp. DEHP117 TaxID=2993436 RepID=UPI0027D56F23|nr:DNA-deoxyinosine glycosylase [Sphingobium sp. DEHP117]MDQ4420095.1 DNA-deoxyinosine glycosylase [Sphingobium sp. DEHP117]